MNVYGPTNWPSPYPEVNDIINEQTPSPETLPPWKRCAQNGWAPHSFHTWGVCTGCCRTREQIAEEEKRCDQN